MSSFLFIDDAELGDFTAADCLRIVADTEDAALEFL